MKSERVKAFDGGFGSFVSILPFLACVRYEGNIGSRGDVSGVGRGMFKLPTGASNHALRTLGL